MGPFDEKIFSSQAAVLALNGAEAYLQGIFMHWLPPTPFSCRRTERDRQTAT